MPRWIKSIGIFLKFWDNQDSDARQNINDLLRQWTFTSLKLLFGRDRDGRYQTSSYGELRVSISRWNIINSIIWTNGRSVLQWTEQSRQHFHRVCFYNWKAFDWDIGRKNGARWYGWQTRISLKVEKNYYWEAFLEKSDNQNFDATNKNYGLAPQYCSTSVMFYIELFMEEFEFLVVEKIKFENWANKMKVALSGDFGLPRYSCTENKSTLFPSKCSLRLRFC